LIAVFHLHRCDRTDVLVAGLAALLATPPADPFTPEVVAVPSRGVERWIAQSLSAHLGTTDSRHDGVCANVEFPSPSRLVREATATVFGIDRDTDPWDEQRLVWHVLATVDTCRDEPWCAVLGRHLAGEYGEQRRVAVAQKLARLFTAYGSQRPGLIRDWVSGGATDGAGAELAEDLRWQPPLWRDLRERVGVPSPAERMDAVCAALRDGPSLVDLPERLSLFGATRLTADEVQVLAALAAHRDVHLWLPHPSPALWQRIADTGAAAGRRRVDPTALLPVHPLLSSLGRDARELQLTLAAAPTDTDEALPGDEERGTLLATLQADVRADRAPARRHTLAPGDVSIQVHACHGAHRQVEVLREVVLGALADDPTLEPRDIVVMCPDIEAHAPLISATFGVPAVGPQRHPGHALRIKLADRSLRQTNPVLSTLARLLALADSRMTASSVLDLAAMPAVRRRFGFDDDALERLGEWVRETGVRWGFDAAARAPYGLATVGAHTWQQGLDRLLLGVAMDTDGLALVGDTLPLDDLASNDAELAGTFAEFLGRLARTSDAFAARQPAAAWRDALARAIDDFTAAPFDEPWQVEGARDQLVAALDADGTAPLCLADVRALLDDRLRGRPTRANFRTGDLTFATLVPMRSVPHRVVCVLGLDDGAFPRNPLTDGDDVLARDPMTGERDLRSEDRQLLLDAVLAARERLVLLYSGADPRTGAIRPPAVPLGELLDTLDATAGTHDGRAARAQVVTHHPLQPFDPRNFAAPEPFSFDPASAAGARAMLAERAEPRAAPARAAVDIPAAVSLDALISFCEHPVRTYVRERLGLAPGDDHTWSDDLPIEADPLGKWAVGDWALQRRLEGIPADRVLAAAEQLPELPLGPAAVPVLAEVGAGVDGVLAAAQPFLGPEPAAVPVSLVLPGGTRLDGTVPGVVGDSVLRLTYSALGPKHRIRAWVQLLALCAASPERPWRSVVVARKGTKGADAAAGEVLELATVPAAVALTTLDNLVALYAAGRSRALPLPLKTSYAYAQHADAGKEKVGLSAAGKEWRRKFNDREIGEFDDPYHVYVWGDDLAFDDLIDEPHDAEPPNITHLFGQLALRLWSPFLRREPR
jgi:exodeoxyribonuclease V gamma subunit